jgi:ubiquinone/menaquinone biosynthesis C-methylase UbiE
MKTEWDYSELADAYLDRPPYSMEALNELYRLAGLKPGALVCDIGAGVAHLTIPLLEAGFKVTAVEPNDAMRANGLKRTADYTDVSWVEAGGEDTGQPDGCFDFVTFGSSFNVMDRTRALKETHRILKPGGSFACLWNHRDLDDPVQKHIERLIAEAVPSYEYGVRREDQSEVIASSGLFYGVQAVSGRLVYTQNVERAVAAWRSHATLHRQAGDKFEAIVDEISAYLKSLGREGIDIPYVTRAWLARRAG